MRYLFGFLCVCALGVVPLVACSKDPGLGECSDASDNHRICTCPEGQSCAYQCGEGIECTIWCSAPWHSSPNEQPCAVDAVDSCDMLCQFSVGDCTANCGDDSLIACQFTEGRCEASVGDNADVRCENAAFCDIDCRGSCGVGCWDGRCRVRCADPEECVVVCSKTEEATLCPDGTTKVCATECSAETLPARHVGAPEVEVAP